MKTKTIISGIIISLLVACCLLAAETQPRISKHSDIRSLAQLQSTIDRILRDSTLSRCFVGIKILLLEKNRILYEKNSRKLFHPGSNIKLLTTAAALHQLDNNFRFTTRIFVDSLIEKGTLKGNLYIQGRGDPLLNTADIDSMCRAVYRSGIRTIDGNLVGDISYFDSVAWGNGWMWDDEPDPDEPFLSPLTVNHNSIHISITPGQISGMPLGIELEPPTTYVHVNNFGSTSSDTSIPFLDVMRIREENSITIRGRISQTDGTQKYTFSVRNPAMYMLNLLKERLLSAGVDVRGILSIGVTRSRMLAAEYSHPLDSVIFRINKESDNLGAENLLRTLASERTRQPGSFSDGILLVKQYLSGIGIDTANVFLADGSGVSWYNEISPNDIVQLMKKEFENKTTFKRFFESLPVSGIDGTLLNQMAGTRAMGKVHAKTGTLTGVSSLSGYVITANHQTIAFSILANHLPGKVPYLREMQNKIMEQLVIFRHGSQK